MYICTDAWRAAIGLWNNHQHTHPLKAKPFPRTFLRIHTILPKPSLILVFCLIIFNILRCGDIHPNPGPNDTGKFNTAEFTFCNLNVRSILAVNDTGARIDHVEQEYSIDNHYDAITMTETKLGPHISDDNVALEGYHIYRKDRTRGGGGVCAYISNSIPTTRLTHLETDNSELFWLKLHFGPKTVYFGVCYRPPGQTALEKANFLFDLETQLDEILPLCRGPNQTVILTGDFNDRTKDWHSPHNESELGQELYNLLNSFNLQQLIKEPTRKDNLLDLLITNNPRLIINSGVLDPIHDLDHCTIFGKLNYNIKYNKPFRRTIWDYPAGDYVKLNDQLLQIPWGLVVGESDNVNDAVEMLTQLIKQCVNNCIPHKTIKIFTKDKSGMTPRVKQLFKTTRRLHKRAQRTNRQSDIDEHKEKRREAKLAWEQAQNKFYLDIENRLRNSENNSRNYWKIIKSIVCTKKTESIPCIVDGDRVATTNSEKAEILNTFFTAQSTIPPAPPDHQLPPFQYLTNSPQKIIQTTPYEVYKILTHLNPNKACGPDLISNKILRECAISLSEPLADLFNKSFNQGVFPQPWKHANVTPIFKKGDRQNKANYRPVSLLSNISKVQERIVFNCLYDHCSKNNLLTDKNSGFKPFDSTINRVIHLAHEIYQGLDSKQEALIVFLDISKAFDRVWHPGLLHKLREFGIAGELYDWLENYLSGRNQKVVIGGEESSTLYTNAGVPQGSILGPLLFLIFINDIVQVVENPLYLFADDASLIKIFSDINETITSINHDLEKLSQWAHMWRVTFNALKTVFMIISLRTRQHHVPPIPIVLNSIPLKQVQQERYLGIVLTSNMTWKEHINQTTAKASKKLGLLYNMKNKLSRQAKSRYYLSFIRPLLEYGNVIFDNCTAADSNSLEQVQRRAALWCTGAFRRSPTSLLLSDLGWDSLANRRKNAKIILMYKILNRLTPNYLTELIPPQVHQSTRYGLRNRSNFRIPFARTQLMKTSYIPATLYQWNILDPELRSCRTLTTFKLKLKSKFKIDPLCKIYSTSFGHCSTFHTQMRLGLSKLKDHLFTYNIIADPSCPYCPTGTRESTLHYILNCPAFAAPREEMFRCLRELLPAEIFRNNRKLLKILIHGNPSATLDINGQIFTIVHRYLSSTGRFSSN